VDGRRARLGEIVDEEMRLNQFGQISRQGWDFVRKNYPNVGIEIACVMPNHVHAIISILYRDSEDVGSSNSEGDTGSGGVSPSIKEPTLGNVVAVYKYETTKRINEILGTPGRRFWQRNFYDRVIRNEREFEAIYDYIEANPRNWEKDEYR
jgi:putative transposase